MSNILFVRGKSFQRAIVSGYKKIKRSIVLNVTLSWSSWKKKKWQKRRVFEMTRGMIKSHCSQFGEIKITLCTRQQKRHWCIEQSYGLCGRGRGWEVLGEWHWNTCNIMYETSCQSRFDARYWMLGAGALGRPRGLVWGGRREEGSGWGTHVYLWRIHFNIWQNQYNIVKFKNKVKKKYYNEYNHHKKIKING